MMFKLNEFSAIFKEISSAKARRVYEIIRLHYTSLKDKQEYKDYRSLHSSNNPLSTI